MLSTSCSTVDNNTNEFSGQVSCLDVFEVRGKLICLTAGSWPILAKKVFILLTETSGSDLLLSSSPAAVSLVSVLITLFTTSDFFY